MTHLRIEQSTGTRETVASSVIKKLYDLAKEIELDANGTIALKGWLYTSATYLDYITYLENISKVDNVQLLTIDAGKKYISFEDPVVASYWANSAYGDGTGIDSTAANSVLSIPNDAFKNNTSILTFDELGRFTNCTTIGHSTFYHCTNLASIDLSNITNLNETCFELCTSLTSVTLNSQMTRIGLGAFSGCLNLVINNVALPNLTTLDGYAFNGTKVKQVSNLGSITVINDHAFNNCSQLTSVTLPSTVLTIWNCAFYNCSSLTTINLSDVTSIRGEAFAGCSSLTSVDLSGCTSIGNDAFSNCTSLGLGQTLELNLTDLTAYPHHMLYGTKYTRLILHSPQLLNTYDGRYPVYEDMNLLLYLDLSDWRPAKNAFNNSYYGDASFYSNDSLVTYIAPITVNNISTVINHLGNYSNFRYLILLSTTPPGLNTTDNNNPPAEWFYNKGGNVHIYVPDSAKAAYLADTDWASIGGYDGSDTIADRLHGLSELPAGVWTTGLASQYLTPALLATS